MNNSDAADNRLIVVVEDDEFALLATAGLVRSLGFAVAEFQSAADFLRSDLPAQAALLIADIRMPGLSGFELHQRLIDAGTPIPTVLVTAYPNETARRRALKAGVSYLAKPFTPEALLACIRGTEPPEPGGGTKERDR